MEAQKKRRKTEITHKLAAISRGRATSVSAFRSGRGGGGGVFGLHVGH
jgi:hypothetical protein